MSKKILSVSNLCASTKDGREILHGIDFDIFEGETVVVLGPNGAGKSTIVSSLMGDPKFKTSGEIKFLGKDLLSMSVSDRAKAGLFCSFQAPIEIPGITTTEVLRAAMSEKENKRILLDDVREKISENAKKIKQNIWFSERELNVGFSGGEKKKNEILQMLTLKPKLVVLDEIDSGLDIDACNMISKVLREYQKQSGCAFLIITHNMKILSELEVDSTILIKDGQNYMRGDHNLAKKIAEFGFQSVFEQVCEAGGIR